MRTESAGENSRKRAKTGLGEAAAVVPKESDP